MKRPEKATSRPLRQLVLPLLLVLAMVLTLVSVPMSGTLDRHLSHVKTSAAFAEDSAATAELSARTVEEGAVLLENGENLLPLSEGSKVCLFGRGSVDAVCSDGRSGGSAIADSLQDAGFVVEEGLLRFYEKHRTEGEVPAADYDAKVLSQARTSADTAIIVLSHTVEEGALLTEEELSLLKLVADMDYPQTVMLVNSACRMQLDFLQNPEYGIDAALWVGAPAENGFGPVGKLLSGEMTPSGRTAATYVYDLSTLSGTDGSEGVYLGYRYFEKRYGEDEAQYSQLVQYPFGYGLSYTSFKEKITGFACNGTDVTVSVKVANTGERSGAQVVELYAQLPETLGGLEKPRRVLVAYGRTGVLESGAAETVELSFAVEQMASFDVKKGCFTLEAGEYQVELCSDAHTVLEKRALQIERDYDYPAVEARLISAQPETLLTAADWTVSAAAYRPEKAAAEKSAAEDTAEVKGKRKSPVKLPQLRDKAYDDEDWSRLLDSLSDKELEALSSFEGEPLKAMKKIGLVESRFLYGGYGLRGMTGGVTYNGTALPSLSLLGSTWDTQLVEDLGAAEGREAWDMGLSGVYGASAMLLRGEGDHYSEDALLTAELVSGFASGVQSSGPLWIMPQIGAENAENAPLTAGEQALRELYIRPAQACVKAGVVAAQVETQSEGGRELHEALLAGEWGFRGWSLGDANESRREQAHGLLYALSRADYDSEAGPRSSWRWVLLAVNLVLVAANLLVLHLRRERERRRRRRRRRPPMNE